MVTSLDNCGNSLTLEVEMLQPRSLASSITIKGTRHTKFIHCKRDDGEDTSKELQNISNVNPNLRFTLVEGRSFHEMAVSTFNNN